MKCGYIIIMVPMAFNGTGKRPEDQTGRADDAACGSGPSGIRTQDLAIKSRML